MTVLKQNDSGLRRTRADTSLVSEVMVVLGCQKGSNSLDSVEDRYISRATFLTQPDNLKHCCLAGTTGDKV